MSQQYSRRDFLKLAGLAITSLAFKPAFNFAELQDSGPLIRIAIDPLKSVSVYSRPDEDSEIKFQHYRDEILPVYYEVISDKKPVYNPLWYRVWGGYVHCDSVQPVQVQLNQVPSYLPDGITPVEVTVPFTQSMFQRTPGTWTESYRLYYNTIHRAVGIAEGPDGETWYRLKDDMLQYSSNMDYYIPAKHARQVQPSEYSPIATDVLPEQKYIEVSLDNQELTAYENSKIIFKTKISSGLDYTPPGESTWKTPTGDFHIQSKMISKHMGNETPYANYSKGAYVLPGVSWVSFFVMGTVGIAFHGTYWHQDFGVQKSHGCINMKTDEARWIFRWATPEADPQSIETNGYGTRVHVY
jgi:hypothetical protein